MGHNTQLKRPKNMALKIKILKNMFRKALKSYLRVITLSLARPDLRKAADDMREKKVALLPA